VSGDEQGHASEAREVLVEGLYFSVDDLPRILGNYMRAADEANREAKRQYLRAEEARADAEVVVRLAPVLREVLQACDVTSPAGTDVRLARAAVAAFRAEVSS